MLRSKSSSLFHGKLIKTWISILLCRYLLNQRILTWIYTYIKLITHKKNLYEISYEKYPLLFLMAESKHKHFMLFKSHRRKHAFKWDKMLEREHILCIWAIDTYLHPIWEIRPCYIYVVHIPICTHYYKDIRYLLSKSLTIDRKNEKIRDFKAEFGKKANRC